MHLLKNARLFAPQSLGVVDVLVGGGAVLAVGPGIDLPSALGATVDLSGLRVVPGLIDAHTHLGGGGGEGGAHTRVPALHLSELTRHGVTTAIGLLGTDTTTRTMADLLAVARGLDHLGITALCYTGGYAVPPVTLMGTAREDLVHVDRIVAIGETAIADHRSSQPTFEELMRLAADAHVAGLMTGKAGLLHLHLGDGKQGLELVRRARAETELPSRVFHPTHCNRNPRLWEEAMQLGADGGYVDVTAFPLDPDDAALPAHAALLAWRERGNAWERVTLTSDGGGCLPTFSEEGVLTHMDVGSPSMLMATVRALMDAGLSLEQALGPVTTHVADLFRLGRKGRVVVGHDADLVVLSDDGTVRDVMARGRWMVQDGLAVISGMFEDRRPVVAQKTV